MKPMKLVMKRLGLVEHISAVFLKVLAVLIQVLTRRTLFISYPPMRPPCFLGKLLSSYYVLSSTFTPKWHLALKTFLVFRSEPTATFRTIVSEEQILNVESSCFRQVVKFPPRQNR